MTDAEYDALHERENQLWQASLAAERAAKAAEAAWEAVQDQINDERLRRDGRERLADKLQAERRRTAA